MKKIAVLLSGCGNKDGSEIHEASICMSSLEILSDEISVECLSVNKDQLDVIDFITNQRQSSTRNVLQESARIARGNIKDISTQKASSYSAAIIIGGLGAVKNLCSFYKDSINMKVDPSVSSFISSMYEDKKPLGAICIAPIILAKLIPPLATEPPTITLGLDAQDQTLICKAWGANVQPCSSDDVVVDEKNKLVTTPAFMNPGSLRNIHPGIYKLAKKIIEMI